MLNELRDLDGTTVARARASVEEATLVLTNTETGQTLRLEGADAIFTLRNLCDEILLDPDSEDEATHN